MKLLSLLSNFGLAALILISTLGAVRADVKLHPIFTDNMVLQRDKPIRVWGTANPGEKVMVVLFTNWDPKIAPIINSLGPESFTTTADTNGNWNVTLRAQSFSNWVLSHTLRVASQEKDGNSIHLENIAIGDVYICSGQSNMEWPVRASNNAQAEIEAANFRNIRLLNVPRKIAAIPQKEFAGPANWQPCTPESVRDFSAVAYYFGRELNQKTGIPIGLIDASWGGTIAEAWTSREALADLGEPYRSSLASFDEFVAEQSSLLKEGEPLRLQKPNQPSVLFNGMMAPLLPFAARGAIWYQGESNAGNPVAYRTLFPALIRDWRTQWNARQDGSEFGFYFVQLANFMARVDQPVQPGWAELREAQASTLSVPRTGMAVAIDIGEADDIHPRNKQDVGKRLALAALAKEYGQDVEYSGPVLERMEAVPNTNRLRISFTHAGGLRIQNTPPVVMPAKEGQEFGDVPLDFWAYESFAKLKRADILEEGYPGTPGTRLMTRYEFAVAIARVLVLLQRFDNTDAVNLHRYPVEEYNILFALEQEFANELRALGVRIGDDLSSRIVGSKKLTERPKILPSKNYVNVPRDHWAYNALRALVNQKVIEDEPSFREELSRSEFTKIIVQLLQIRWNRQDGPAQPVVPSSESLDAIAVLKMEFRAELTILGIQSESVDVGRPPSLTPVQRLSQRNYIGGAQVKGFAVQNEKGEWYWANARIDGETVVVWSDQVSAPKAVRYAWANNPDVNLVNAAGLPAVPFRTDVP